MNRHELEASSWLRILHEGSDQNEYFIRRILEEARKGNLSLDVIGTSEKELEELRIKGCMTAARNLLDKLRPGSVFYDSFLRYLREEAHKGNFSLADIGTSEKELEELRIKGCMTAACNWLAVLRRGNERFDACIGYLREEAHKGNFSLAVIGTSEEELEELRIKDCMTAARNWLAVLRRGNERYDMCIGYLREEAHKGNFSLAVIGTSEEELASIRRDSA